jgi:hypothetical protein
MCHSDIKTSHSKLFLVTTRHIVVHSVLIFPGATIFINSSWLVFWDLKSPSSTLRMEAAHSSRTLVLIYQTTRRHISDGHNLFIHRGKNQMNSSVFWDITPYSSTFSIWSLITSCSGHGALPDYVQYKNHYHTMLSTRSHIILFSIRSIIKLRLLYEALSDYVQYKKNSQTMYVQYTDHCHSMFSIRSLIIPCSIHEALSFHVQYTEPYNIMFSIGSIIISCPVYGALSYSVQ